MNVKTNLLVELKGPGGNCKVPAEKLKDYLDKGWKRIPFSGSPFSSDIIVKAEKGNYELGFEKDYYDYIPHDSKSLKNRHRNKTIFILGDGPSLKTIPKEILDNYITIGANRINMYYTPTYQLATDSRMLFNRRNPFQSSKTKKFWLLSHYYNEFNPSDIHTIKASKVNEYNKEGFFLRYKIDEGYLPDFWKYPILSSNIKYGLRIGRTIIIAMINLAYILGAKRICIIGLDMNFNNHFYKPLNDRQEKEKKLPYPHFDVINEAFEKIVGFLHKKRIKIFNLNSTSAIRCIPFADVKYKATIKEVKNDC